MVKQQSKNQDPNWNTSNFNVIFFCPPPASLNAAVSAQLKIRGGALQLVVCRVHFLVWGATSQPCQDGRYKLH